MLPPNRRVTQFLKIWLTAFVDVRRLVALIYLPRYIRQYYGFRKISGNQKITILDSHPCLTDAVSKTPFDAHYFYQAAWLARSLNSEKPVLHVDVGSSVNMLSILSANHKVIFVDYRPLNASLDQLLSVAGSITSLPFQDNSIDSMSSLHVIEHIGLGRYGDPLDPKGTESASREIIRVLRQGAMLYVSVPVGRERICFNAHRVFDPDTILKLFEGLELRRFSMVDDMGKYYPEQDIAAAKILNYGCGMFVFQK